MHYSRLFGRTTKDAPKDEIAINAKYLTRGGFIRKEVSGVYNYLPLGLNVLNRITKIVRQEMEEVGGQEILLSALQNKLSWQKTGRWDSFDALYKVLHSSTKPTPDEGGDFALGPTHEEVIVPLVKQFVNSYKDLPLSLYQIQTKFRDELRAKSGILRGREFLMKDMYSFHADEKDFENYYEKVKVAYKNVFERLKLNAILTEASGGAFSKFSHEYQVLTEDGEDTIFYCSSKGCLFAQNKEITTVKVGDTCEKCAQFGHDETIKEGKSIEVGNIFPLKTKFSDVFGLTYIDKYGNEKQVFMGCYGIGISRLMGAIVEASHDEKGIIWPEEVAPYKVHLIALHTKGQDMLKKANEVYDELRNKNIEVLFDDRSNVSSGEKFADADLLGMPYRIVVAANTDLKGTVELKERKSEELPKHLPLEKILQILKR